MMVFHLRDRLQILLDEAGTQADIHLYQRRIADRLETVNLTRLDNKNVSNPCAVHMRSKQACNGLLQSVIGATRFA